MNTSGIIVCFKHFVGHPVAKEDLYSRQGRGGGEGGGEKAGEIQRVCVLK